MPRLVLTLCGFTLIAWFTLAQEPSPDNGAKKKDYAEFSRLIHGLIIKAMPEEIEDRTHWGQTIPIPDKLLLPQIRTYVKVGDKKELPHGTWFKMAGKVEKPANDVKIVVRDFSTTKEKKSRLVLNAEAKLAVRGDFQQWQKGLMLVGARATGDAVFDVNVVCDVAVKFDLKQFPPAASVDPTVVDLKIELRDFKLRGDDENADGEVGKLIRTAGKELLRELIKTQEPGLRAKVNDVIAQAVKEGKGVISLDAILRTAPMPELNKSEK